MYAFRYNPIVNRWVLLGGPVNQQVDLTSAHLIKGGPHSHLLAATYPKQPFIVEPPATFGMAPGLLYKEEPPVGEYELLLYAGQKTLRDWRHHEWDEWLQLVQHRLLQVHQNPYLHHVQLTVRTAAEETVTGYHRVGDLIATSHPVAGQSVELTPELAEKIKAREHIFTLHTDQFGTVQVPSAPTHPDEMWYLPATPRSGVEMVHGDERQAVSKIIAWLMSNIMAAYPHHHYVLSLHTALAGDSDDVTWWFQIYREVHNSEFLPLPVQSLPEVVLRHLREILHVT